MIYEIKAGSIIEAVLLSAVFIFRFALDYRQRSSITVADVLPIFLIPLVGLFGYNKNVYYGFLFFVPLLWSGDAERLPKRYLLTLIMFPQLAQPYVVGGIYLGMWSAILTFNAGSLIALVIARRASLKPIMSIDIAMWLVFFCTFLISARGEILNGVLRESITAFLLVMPAYLIVSRLIVSRKMAADAISFLALGGLCNACIAIVESAKHWSLYESLAGGLHVSGALMSANLAMRAGFLRASGSLLSYEEFGCLCGLSLLAMIALRRRFSSGGFVMIVLLLTAGLLSSQARSAWLGTGVGLIAQAVYDRQWRRMSIFIGGGGLAAALAVLLSSRAGRFGEIIGTSGHAGSTSDYRRRLLERGLEEARRHPWTGQTLAQLQVSMNDMRQGQHIIDFVNTHLNVLLVGGSGGLAAWLLAWCIPLMWGWSHRPKHRSLEPALTSLPFAHICVLFVYLTFTSATDREMPLLGVEMALMSAGLRLPANKARRPYAQQFRIHSSMPAPPHGARQEAAQFT